MKRAQGPVDIGDATEKSPRDALKRASMPAMAASRTIGEQEALERVVSGRGKAMDFSSGNEVGTEDLAAGAAPVRKGRERFNFLNPVPIQAIYDRWIATGQEIPTLE